MSAFSARSIVVSEPARAKLLSAIDANGGSVTTVEILNAGLSPRAANNMVSDGLLDIGPMGFCRPRPEGDRPTEKGATTKARVSRTCDMEKCAPRVSAYPTEIAALVAKCPKTSERAILRAFRWRDPAKTVTELMREASAAERAGRFGASRMLRRMHDIIVDYAHVPTVEDVSESDAPATVAMAAQEVAS